jgi:hypothetical protein
VKIPRFTHYFASFAVAAFMTLASGSLGQAQTAGQDLHKAGTTTKNAAKETGSGVKKGTSEGYDKTKQGTKAAARDTEKGTTKAYDKTKEGTKAAAQGTKKGTTKAYDKTKDGAEHLTH